MREEILWGTARLDGKLIAGAPRVPHIGKVKFVDPEIVNPEDGHCNVPYRVRYRRITEGQLGIHIIQFRQALDGKVVVRAGRSGGGRHVADRRDGLNHHRGPEVEPEFFSQTERVEWKIHHDDVERPDSHAQYRDRKIMPRLLQEEEAVEEG